MVSRSSLVIGLLARHAAGWTGATLQLSHSWDCKGMRCDSATLREWDKTRTRHIPAHGYAPQDPAEHGGSEYGERMWLVGSASDAVADMLGPSDPCCGSDSTGGCGKCMLIQNPDAVHADWTAVIMKKSRCVGPDCGRPSLHFNVAVPGYDRNASTFGQNVCGERPGTLFDNPGQSMLNGKWEQNNSYNNFSSTSDAGNIARCDLLPDEFVAGCRLFSEWGWRTPHPKTVQYKTVECPANFSKWIGQQFNEDGIVPHNRTWYGKELVLTHFWDCNGMGCDSATLRPWDPERYIAAPGYSPQDPSLHGGSLYGEKMWLVGAASDALARVLGSDGGCCGLDYNSPGCGKCLLIQNPAADRADWTAVVMKKSRCPPWTKGCNGWSSHFDIAVPGFDNLQESTANVCSDRQGTLFEEKSESGVLGDWYKRSTYNSTGQCTTGCSLAEQSNIDRCQWLPPEFARGCRLFAEWGWTTSPKNVRYRRVECPQNFVEWVEGAFSPSGILHSDTKPTMTTTTTSTNTTSTTTSTSTNTTSTMTTTSTTTTTEVNTTSSQFLSSTTTALAVAIALPEDEDAGLFNSKLTLPLGIGSAAFLVLSCALVCCIKRCNKCCIRKKKHSGDRITPKHSGKQFSPKAPKNRGADVAITGQCEFAL